MPPRNPTVVLHGFTQTPLSGAAFARGLGPESTVDAPFLPGHGPEPVRPTDLWGAADGFARSTPSTFVGYSMGARVALHVALAHPTVVTELVLISATPGIADSEARRERRLADDVLADHIEEVGTATFLREWLTQDMFASLPSDDATWEDRLVNTPGGLAAALRRLGTGRQEDLRDRLADLSMPVLVVAGERDHKFTAAGREIVEGVGRDSTMVVMPGTGHAVHLEDPRGTAKAVSTWRQRVRAR